MTSLNLDITPSQIQKLNKQQKKKKSSPRGGSKKVHKHYDWNSIEETYAPEATNFLDLSDINDYNYYEKQLDKSIIHNDYRLNLKQIVNNAVDCQKDDIVCSPILSEYNEEDNTQTYKDKLISISPIREYKNQQQNSNNQNSKYDDFKSHPLVKSKTSNSKLQSNPTNNNILRDNGAQEDQRSKQGNVNKLNQSIKNISDDQIDIDEYIDDEVENIIQNNNNNQVTKDTIIGVGSVQGVLPDYVSLGNNDKSFIDYLNSTVLTTKQHKYQKSVNDRFESKSTMVGSQFQEHDKLPGSNSPDEYAMMHSNPTNEDISPVKRRLLHISNVDSNYVPEEQRDKHMNKNINKTHNSNHQHNNSQQLLLSEFKTANSSSPISSVRGNSKQRKRDKGRQQNSPPKDGKGNQLKKVIFRDQVRGGKLCEYKQIQNKIKCTAGCCQADPDQESGKMSCACIIF